MDIKIVMSQVSDGASQEGNAIRQVSGSPGTPTSMDVQTSTVVNLSLAQFQGLISYIGLIQRGGTTSAIETAITGAL